jgi:hypothetical protein
MSYQHSAPSDKDPMLWELAKKRADFKSHFQTYVLVNIFLWAIWALGNQNDHRGMPWPVYPTLGWGIGVFFHYLGAYRSNGTSAVEKEYNKLLNDKK